MKRVLVAAALGGLLLVGAPTLASSAQRDSTQADKGDHSSDKGSDKGDHGNKGDDNKADRADKGDRGDRGDRGDHRSDRDGHRYYYGGYPYYGGYYGEPYDCYYGRSGAYNCEPYGGDYDYGRGSGYRGDRDRQVLVRNKAFNPPEVYAYPGQEVLWVFSDGNVPHTVTADNHSFDSGKVTESEFRIAFDRPGSYSYHCEVHPDMQGRVIVRG